jgi:uncharacterized repeat protein (TIGR02543 family)
MSKKAIRVVFVSVAAIMAFSIPLYGCSPSDSTDTETKITFDYNDGSSRPYYSYAEAGDTVKEPETPIRTGYEFAYWQTEENGGERVTFPYTFTEDTTLYAHWEAKQCTVTFNLNDDNSTSYQEVSVAYNSTVSEPTTEPTNGVYTFYYWQDSSDNDSATRVEFPYTVTSDITFYARWGTGNMYIIQLNSNYEGAESVDPLEIAPGNKIAKKDVTNPERTGYKFIGWGLTKDATSADKISLPYKPTSSLTLYAIWEKQQYTVEFSENYVDATSSSEGKYVTVDSGESVNAPTVNPTREGYTFAGWYTLKNSGAGTLVEFPYTPERNTTLYAHWTSELVQTNIFDAEFTEIPYNRSYSGYSGAVKGTSIIIPDSDGSAGAKTQSYPLNSSNISHTNYYVSYLYDYEDTLTFVIQAEEAVSNATLYVCWTGEITPGLTIGPSGSANTYQFIVNGEEVTYTPYTFKGSKPATGQYKGVFEEYRINSISLKKGENIIKLVTANTNKDAMGGGTLGAVAPMIDYIRIDTSVVLKWSPVYDNIYTW